MLAIATAVLLALSATTEAATFKYYGGRDSYEPSYEHRVYGREYQKYDHGHEAYKMRDYDHEPYESHYAEEDYKPSYESFYTKGDYRELHHDSYDEGYGGDAYSVEHEHRHKRSTGIEGEAREEEVSDRSQQWRKADPLSEHSFTTRNKFANPLHTVFGVKAKKVLEESRQAILGKSYDPRPSYKGRRPKDCSLENMSDRSKSIINGREAADNQFPWVVFIWCNAPQAVRGMSCTGSLISDRWVLTAAHCLEGCSKWTIQAGSNMIKGRDDSRVVIDTTVGIPHPEYDDDNLLNDIAVILLPRPAPLSDTIRVGCLPGRSQLNDKFEDDLMTLTGWGKTCDGDDGCRTNNLNFAKHRPVMPNHLCKRVFRNVDDGMICIDTDANTRWEKNIGICSGDSGGPLNLEEGRGTGQYMTVGVASFVSARGCERILPHVYARVTHYMNWISRITGIPIMP